MSDNLPIFLTFGHHICCTSKNFTILIIVYFSFLMHFAAIYYAYWVKKKTCGIRYWTSAWWVFIIMILLGSVIRRGFSVHANLDLLHIRDGNFGLIFFIDALWMVALSVGYLVFIFKIKKFLNHYYLDPPK